MNKEQTLKMVDILLRIGVAFSFLYPPFSALFNPYSWVGYFPAFFSLVPIDPILMLHVFGLCEVVIGLWLLFAKNVFIPSVIALVMLALIVLFNWNQMDVLFRDISILFMAAALVLLHKKPKEA